MKFTSAAAALLLLPSALAASLVPRRYTPNFYLFAVPDMVPVRGDASGNTLSLTSGSPSKFYLDGNSNLAVDNGGSYTTIYINFIQVTASSCPTTGYLQVVTGSSTNKCARNSGFYISSYEQNSQLGAKLVFNWEGAFYNCNGQVTYSATGAPYGCSALTLWTVPATQ